MSIIKNIDKSAPVWMQKVMAALLMAVTAKPFIINTFPGISEASATLAGQWFDWIANMIAFAFAVVALFTKSKTA